MELSVGFRTLETRDHVGYPVPSQASFFVLDSHRVCADPTHIGHLRQTSIRSYVAIACKTSVRQLTPFSRRCCADPLNDMLDDIVQPDVMISSEPKASNTTGNLLEYMLASYDPLRFPTRCSAGYATELRSEDDFKKGRVIVHIGWFIC